MKPAVAALSLAVLWSAGALAASSPERIVPLREVIAQMEARYQGEVVAARLDDSGDKPLHYHVDVRYPEAGVAKLDVDAYMLAISAREQARPGERWTTSLAGAAAYAATLLQGQVLAAELDAIDGEPAHYDVDVRLANNAIARVKVDPVTRSLAWRANPVVAP